MKVLFFTDIHGNLDVLKEIKQKAEIEGVGLLVCAGDVSLFEDKLDTIMYAIDDLGIPTLLIHGNHESEEKVRLYCDMLPNITFFHAMTYEVSGIIFMGYGGGGFAATDSLFRKVSKQFRKKMKKKTSVLVLHGPPYGTKLDDLYGDNTGNMDFRAFIDEFHPNIVICGHIHENFGVEDKIGNSRIINPGPKGIILDL